MTATACTIVQCPECDEPIKTTVALGHTMVDGGIKLYPIGVDDSLFHRHYAKAHAKAQEP